MTMREQQKEYFIKLYTKLADKLFAEEPIDKAAISLFITQGCVYLVKDSKPGEVKEILDSLL